MAFERREFSGDAVAAVVVGTIASNAVAITISDASGWPSGAGGKFYAVLERGTSNEEKILVNSRSGNILTLASAGDRGADGTSAAAHSGGSIEHCIAKQDVDEANFTVANTVGRVTTAGDDIVATAPNTFGRLPIGADNTVRVVDLSTPTKQKWTQLNEAHLATSVAGAGLTGGNGTPLAVNPDGATLEINLDTVRVKNAGITGAKLDPAIVDSSTLQLVTGVLSVAPGGIVEAQIGFPARTAYTPSWTGTGVSIGNGTINGFFRVLGKELMFTIVLVGGSSSNGGSGPWSFSLPAGLTSAAHDQVVAAIIVDATATHRYPATGIVNAGSTTVARVAVPDGSIALAAGDPISFSAGSKLVIGGTIEIA